MILLKYNSDTCLAGHPSCSYADRKRLLIAAFSLLVLSGCALFDSDKARSWHAFRSSGQAALSKDDYAVAQTSFQAALKEVDSLPRETLRQAISLKDLSAVCLHIKNDKLAGQLTDKAIALAGAPGSDGNSLFVLYEVGQTFNNLGEYYFKQVKDFDKAVLLYGRADAIFENLIRQHASNPPDCFAGYHLGKSLSGLGQAYAGLQKEKEAMRLYSKAADPQLLPAIPEVTRRQLTASYAELPQVSAADKAAYATSLGINTSEKQVPENVSRNHLARARQLIRLGQLETAQKELLKAQMSAETLPQPSRDLAEILQTLGICYIRQLNFSEAEPALLRALSIFEKTSAGDPRELAYCLYTIGQLYTRANMAEKAEPYALRRRQIWVDTVGPEDSNVVQSDLFLGEIYFAGKKLDKAFRFYNEALDLCQKNKRAEPRLLARSNTGVGQVLVAKNNYAAARPYLEKALEFWHDHSDTDPDFANLAQSLYTEVKQHLGISSSVTTPAFHSSTQAP